MEAQRISRENTRREREERRQSFNDDPSDVFAAMMQGEQLDVGLRLLADDVGRLMQFLDFDDAEMMADVRELTERFMQVAKRAVDAIEDPDCPQALAWQRVFKLLRKVSTRCEPEAMEEESTEELEAVPAFDDCGPMAFVMSSMSHSSSKHRASLRKRIAKMRERGALGCKPKSKRDKKKKKKDKKRKK